MESNDQINEVSVIDVDWDDDTLEDMLMKDLNDKNISMNNLTQEDKDYLLNLLLFTINQEQIESWIKYWDKEGTDKQRVRDFMTKLLRYQNSVKNKIDIRDAKDEEGI